MSEAGKSLPWLRMDQVAALIMSVLAGLGLVSPTGPANFIARGSVGHDVSYPQCGRVLPAVSSFGIVGVAGGKPYTGNPCLTSEFAWANSTSGGPSFYMNTANPGPATHELNWYGQRFPDTSCAPGRDAACAYNYGYSAAAVALAYAQSHTGRSANTMWWLDVETENSWSRTDLGANVASLRGTIDFLQRQPGVQVGIYALRNGWARITGGATFNLPNWVAGASNLADARARCSPAYSITGGPVVLTQWVNGYDLNYAC
ncbi:MAG: hypothetical protein M3Y04_02595 [Actinomycetota bacterium]|nr:hypothetical protein [Actinomycetota bacterium]